MDHLIGFVLGIMAAVFTFEYNRVKNFILESFRRRIRGSGYTPSGPPIELDYRRGR